MITPIYNCPQADLYNIGRDGWYSCGLRLAVFAALKSKYTDEFQSPFPHVKFIEQRNTPPIHPRIVATIKAQFYLC